MEKLISGCPTNFSYGKELKTMSNKKTDKSRTHAANLDDQRANSDNDKKKVPTSATNRPLR